jgi:serine/threonine-protein kinase PpkA
MQALSNVFRMIAFICPILCLCLGLALAGDVRAADRSPLLQAGKKTLFQRVVSHPGARLYAGPGPQDGVRADAVATFTVFYVYARAGDRL